MNFCFALLFNAVLLDAINIQHHVPTNFTSNAFNVVLLDAINIQHHVPTNFTSNALIEKFDCDALPGSMNGPKWSKGCAGAVWGNGQPADEYCKNTNGRYPWWAACCKWENNECIPKWGYSSQCTYKGYAPGFVNSVQRTNAVKPAPFQESVLEQSLSYLNAGTEVAQASLEMIAVASNVMKSAPQVAAVLGIINVGLGFLEEDISPNDILDKAFESVKLLSDEVNVMMDQMTDYVDAKDLQLEKNIMSNHYRELYDRWIGCGRETTIDGVNDCQRRAVNALRSKRYHFQPLHNEFDQNVYNPDFRYRSSAGTWQWMEKYNVRRLSHDQVKRLEIGILPFRDYASLHLLALKTLEATLRDKSSARTDYKRYVGEMASAADMYIKYAKWAYEWSYIRQYEENDFFGVSGRAGGRPSAWRSEFGGIVATRNCSSVSKCTIECTQMFSDNTCSVYGGDAMGRAIDKCEEYLKQVKTQLNQFWDNNVLNVVNTWQKYADDAKAKL